VETGAAVTLKLAEVEEAGTVTDGGTVRAVLLEASPTTAPPVEAALESVTVQPVVEQVRVEIKS